MKIQSQRGFTILEVMLAVTIIGIMALLAVVRILDTDRRAAYITAHKLVADMRLTRANAIAKGKEHVVKFYPGGAGPYTGYRIFEDGKQGNVADAIESVSIRDELTVVADPGNAAWVPELMFTVLGNIGNAGTGVIINVTGGGHQVNIEATVATGKVTVQ